MACPFVALLVGFFLVVLFFVLRTLRKVRHVRIQKQHFILDKDARLRSGARGLAARKVLTAFEKTVAETTAKFVVPFLSGLKPSPPLPLLLLLKRQQLLTSRAACSRQTTRYQMTPSMPSRRKPSIC